MKVTHRELENRMLLGSRDIRGCRHGDKVNRPLDEDRIEKRCRRCGTLIEIRDRCQATVTVSTHIERRCLSAVGGGHTLCLPHQRKEEGTE